jgi:hypothetical protein
MLSVAVCDGNSLRGCAAIGEAGLVPGALFLYSELRLGEALPADGFSSVGQVDA